MCIILYIIMLVGIYINSFKEDFSEENLNKLAPVFAIAGVICVLSILVTIIKGG